MPYLAVPEVIAVSQAYFELGAARGRLHAAEQALSTATTTQAAVTAKRTADESLIAAIGVPADTRLEVLDSTELPLPCASDGRPCSTIDRPGQGIFLSFSIPLFDGGARRSRVSIADAKVREAQEQLAAVRDTATQQVVRAYNALITSLRSTRQRPH